MAKTKTVSNEIIISALLQNGTIEKAAAAAGVSARTIYDRMREQEFSGLYAHAKAGVLRAAVNSMNKKLSIAVDVIAEIMQDESANQATRLQACQTLLNTCGKYNELLSAAEKTANKASTPPAEELANLLGLL